MAGAPSTITSEKCSCVLRVEFLLKTDSGYFLNIGSTSVVGENYEQSGVDVPILTGGFRTFCY